MSQNKMLLLLLALLFKISLSQTFTSITNVESNTIQNHLNTLTFTLTPSVEIPANDIIEITGLTGSTTYLPSTNFIIYGANAIKFGTPTATTGTGTWTHATGTLSLTVNAPLLINENFVIIIVLRNPSSLQTTPITPSIRTLTGATENIVSTAFPTSVLSAATSDNYLNASATPTDGGRSKT